MLLIEPLGNIPGSSLDSKHAHKWRRFLDAVLPWSWSSSCWPNRNFEIAMFGLTFLCSITIELVKIAPPAFDINRPPLLPISPTKLFIVEFNGHLPIVEPTCTRFANGLTMKFLKPMSFTACRTDQSIDHIARPRRS